MLYLFNIVINLNNLFCTLTFFYFNFTVAYSNYFKIEVGSKKINIFFYSRKITFFNRD